MFRMTAIVSILSFLSMNSGHSATWAEYRELYFQNDEALLSAQASVQLSENELNLADDLWNPKLSIAPSFNSKDIVGLSLLDKESYLQTTFTQQVPWGSLLSLKYLDDLSINDVDGSYVNSSWSVGLSQSLLYNSFGHLDRLKIDFEKEKTGLKKMQWKMQKLKSCQTAANNYFGALKSSLDEEIYKEFFMESKKTFRFMKKAFKKRLIKKINFLTATGDYKQVQSDYLIAQQAHYSKMSLLNQSLEKVKIKKLLDPKIFKNDLKLGTATEKSLELQVKKQSLKSAEKSVLVAKNKGQDLLDLSLELGNNDGFSGGANYKERFIKASLKWEWDGIDSSSDLALYRAAHAKTLTELDLKKTRESLSEELLDLKNKIQISRQQLKLNLEKVKIFSEQLREASRLLRAGKVEFIDYIRYRDQLLFEKQKSNQFKTELSLLYFEAEKIQMTNRCGELS